MSLAIQLGVGLSAVGTPAGALIPVDFAPRLATMLVDTTLGGNWSAVNGTYTHAALPLAAPSGQTAGPTISVSAGSNVTGSIRSITSAGSPLTLDSSHFVALEVYLDQDPPSGMRIDLRMTKESSGSPVNYKTYGWGKSTNALKQGWNFLVVKLGETGSVSPHGAWTTTGTVGPTDIINRYELRFFFTSAASAITVRFGRVVRYSGPLARPCVIFTTDGALYAGQQTYAVPFCAVRGIVPTVSVGGDSLVSTPAPWLALRDAGWLLMPQDRSHVDAVTSGTYAADLAFTVSAMQAARVVRNIEDVMCTSMPFSSANTASRAIALSQGVRWSRENPLPGVAVTDYGPAVGDYVSQGSMDTALQNLAAMKARIDYAVAYGLTVCFHWHDIVAGGTGTTITGDSEQTYANDLEDLLDYAVAKREAGEIVITSPAAWLRSARRLA